MIYEESRGVIMTDIPQYNTFTKIQPINKGWSSDKKFYIETQSGEELLLRISDISEYNKKQAEFDIVCAIAKQSIPMSQPIDFGICNGGESVYMLLSWIDGEDAEVVLPSLSPKEQYALGVKAGEILKKIHAIPAPATQEEWKSRFNSKISRKIEGYNKCDIKIDDGEKILAYIDENRHLIKNCPQCLHHGDYHVGNMIISKSGELSVIDFNRFDYGDPWEEFNRIVWCVDYSKYFATGRIDGYFGGRPPKEFWKLLALYISSNMLSSIYWAISFGQSEIDTMINQAKGILDYYDGMTNPVPKWYLEDMH